MTRPSLGFWAMVLVVVLRGWSVAPAIIAQGPGGVVRLSVALFVLVVYIATALATTRRVQSADRHAAADFAWLLGSAGLALAVAILMLWLG
jgi:hypothetical protein